MCLVLCCALVLTIHLNVYFYFDAWILKYRNTGIPALTVHRKYSRPQFNKYSFFFLGNTFIIKHGFSVDRQPRLFGAPRATVFRCTVNRGFVGCAVEQRSSGLTENFQIPVRRKRRRLQRKARGHGKPRNKRRCSGADKSSRHFQSRKTRSVPYPVRRQFFFFLDDRAVFRDSNGTLFATGETNRL